MRVAVCDICLSKTQKLVRGLYKMGYRNGVKLDVCNEHRTFVSSCTSPAMLAEKYYALVK